MEGQLLSLLVMDLGYTKEPMHGHAPIRHQIAWSMAVEAWSKPQLDAEVKLRTDDMPPPSPLGLVCRWMRRLRLTR